MILVIQNNQLTSVVLNSELGTVPPRRTVTIPVTIAQLEAIRPTLVRLASTGAISWATNKNPDSSDDGAEGATIAYVDGSGPGGFVTGPISSTNNAVPRFDGVDGTSLKDSVVTVSDGGNISTPGTVDGRDISTDGSKLDTIETNADVTDAANVAAAGAVMDSDFTGTNVGALRRTGVGIYAVLQDNLTAVVDPTTSADSASGYSVGSLWVNTLTNQVFICADAGVGSAVWRQNGGGVTDHGALTGLADDDHTQYLLVNGTRAMTGDLDMGGQDVSNVGTVDGRDVSADGTKLDTIETNADVTDATNVNAAGAVMESDYTPAHSLLVQQSGTGSPSSLSVGNNTILGRASGGGSPIAALSAASVKTILNYQGSEVSFTPNGDIAATDVQSAVVEVRNDTDAKLGSKVDLAGQLGGTAASPDVRGVRETSGPTLLTMGAIADGEYLRRSGTTVVGGTPSGGGGGVEFRGLRGFSAANAYTAAGVSALNGNASPGFTVLAAVVVDVIRGLSGDMQVIAGTTNQFIGDGYRLAFNGEGPRHVITDGAAGRQENFVGNWISAMTQPKALAILSLEYNGTNRVLRSFGSTAFTAAMTGYTASIIPFRVGSNSNGTDHLTNGLVALGVKTDGVVTPADIQIQVDALLATGDFVDGTLTNRWSIRSLSTGAAPSTLTDAIGSEDLTLSGSLTVQTEYVLGAAIAASV